MHTACAQGRVTRFSESTRQSGNARYAPAARQRAPSSVRSSRATGGLHPASVELRTDFDYRPRSRINFVGFAHIALSIHVQLTASLRPRPKKASIAEFTA